jgi:DNA repair protein RadC
MHPNPYEILPSLDGAVDGRSSDGLPVRLVRDRSAATATCPHCGGRLEVSTVGGRWQARRPSDIADRLVVQLGGLEREELHALLLDTKVCVIAQVRLYAGNVSSALVRVGELFTEAIRCNAAGIVLVHNHPSGDATPSPDDLHLTAEAIAAGRLLDVPLLDHLIVGGSAWVSLREHGVPFDGPGGRQTPGGTR